MKQSEHVVGMVIRISTCVCTYRRPGVVDTVRSLLCQAGIAHSDLEIIVADDDPGLSARKAILDLAINATILIRYITSSAQNISSCRNSCLRVAKGDWIAFIDDDQVAEPEWLQEMMKTASEFGADAVKCYVRGIYPPETPGWVRAGSPFTYDYGPTGRQIRFADTCGILFRRDLPGVRDLSFAVELGVTGGEDTDFFLRYQTLGGKIVSCRAAVANEIVALDRVQPDYLKRRRRRQGHIIGCVLFARKTLFGRSLSIMKSLVVVMVTFPYVAMRICNQPLSCLMFMKFWHHIGILEWALARAPVAHE
jgi:succinoglycan biosynthesis protein ExoM